jgi:hypothetical protein
MFNFKPEPPLMGHWKIENSFAKKLFIIFGLYKVQNVDTDLSKIQAKIEDE